MIAVIVCAALAIPTIGILAAIAVPAYQDYVLRAKVMQASAAAQPLQATIDRGAAALDACPRNGEAGIGTADSYAGPLIASVNVGAFENGNCGYEIVLRGTGSSTVDGKKLWWEHAKGGDGNAQGWRCSTEMAAKYLPLACRAH